MEEKSFLQGIREGIRRALRALFPEDMMALIGQAARGENREDPAEREDAPLRMEQAAPGQIRQRRDGGMTISAGQTDHKESPGALPARVRRHLSFFGRVQGVGFRYHLMYDARNQGLTGWVENLPDGSVEAELQGSPEAIDFVVRNLGNGRWIRIDGMESRQIPVVESERGFRVRGY